GDRQSVAGVLSERDRRTGQGPTARALRRRENVRVHLPTRYRSRFAGKGRVCRWREARAVMRLRTSVVVLCVLLVSGCQSRAARPSIVLILIDQLRKDTSDQVLTEVNRLAARRTVAHN